MINQKKNTNDRSGNLTPDLYEEIFPADTTIKDALYRWANYIFCSIMAISLLYGCLHHFN